MRNFRIAVCGIVVALTATLTIGLTAPADAGAVHYSRPVGCC